VRRVALIVAALACFALAAGLGLLALDVARWRTAVEDGDVRYRVAPAEQGHWSSEETVPFHLARSLLDVDDDVQFRVALRTLGLAGISAPDVSDPALAARRSEARAQIAAVAERDEDPVRRSRALSLLGVLSFASAIAEPENQGPLIQDALARFRSALELDPDNAEAKANLEVGLQRESEAGESGGGQNPTPGGEGARGAGAGTAGSGY
jgi:hypothetical protein